MGGSSKEPLFTPKQWALILVLWIFYALALFSMGPEWVGWAGPIAFGGALTATGAPPSAAFPESPKETFTAAGFLLLIALAAITLPACLRREPGPDWFGPLRGLIQAVQRRRHAHSVQVMKLRGKLNGGALLPERRGSSIGQENRGRYSAGPAQDHATPASERNRTVPRSL